MVHWCKSGTTRVTGTGTVQKDCLLLQVDLLILRHCGCAICAVLVTRFGDETLISGWVISYFSRSTWNPCFSGAAGVLVGHPFDTVKVGVCRFHCLLLCAIVKQLHYPLNCCFRLICQHMNLDNSKIATEQFAKDNKYKFYSQNGYIHFLLHLFSTSCGLCLLQLDNPYNPPLSHYIYTNNEKILILM